MEATTATLEPVTIPQRLDIDAHAPGFSKAMAHLDHAATKELDRVGFDPAVDGPDDETAVIAFAHCPFRELAEAHPDLVCSLHRGMVEGFVALYQKCPHLGCRVPWCQTSQWFECPCHGSKYNRVGEKKGGPAPRGMDRFSMEVDGTNIVVDTAVVVQGPPIGTDTTGQGQEGAACV